MVRFILTIGIYFDFVLLFTLNFEQTKQRLLRK